MREACIKISPSYKPGITFVVVQKRHHTRFFPVNPKDEVCHFLSLFFFYLKIKFSK